MTDIPRFVRSNPDEVAAKVLDGEAILINLVTGVYYSMDGSGAETWSWLEATGDVQRTVEALCAGYAVEPDRCRAEVERLVGELIGERLLLPAEEPAGAGEPPAGAGRGRSWIAPVLSVYRDMNDLMALDPPVPGLAPIPWDDPQAPPSRQ
jgi:hypothetical protein